MLEHPSITRTMQTGYPYSERRNEVGEDAHGNEVHAGDEIIEFDGEFYLEEELSTDAVEILERHGGIRVIAQ